MNENQTGSSPSPVRIEDLIAADDPVRMEDPGPELFCRRDATDWFKALVGTLKERFPEVSCRTGFLIQNAGFHGELAIRKGDRAALLRCSNFGYFAAIWDNDQCLSEAERRMVERILEMQGDRLVDAELLECKYTGRNPGVSGFRTWRERYFEFIPVGSRQSLLDILAAKRADPTAWESDLVPPMDVTKFAPWAKEELRGRECPLCLRPLQDAYAPGPRYMSRYWCARCGFEITTSARHPTHVYLALHDPVDEPPLAAAHGRYDAKAHPCRCGKKAGELRWFYYCSPGAMWAHIGEMVGWMTYCEACRREVDFFREEMN